MLLYDFYKLDSNVKQLYNSIAIMLSSSIFVSIYFKNVNYVAHGVGFVIGIAAFLFLMYCIKKISMAYKTNRITYQVVQLLWGLTRTGAITRLAAVRERLEKTHCQSLNVFEYCEAERITIEQFDVMMKRAQEKL